jgi:hypothetical protein
MIKLISFHESLTLRECLCVTFMYEKEEKKHGIKLYLSLCNGKWLKLVWILTFLFSVCST